MAQLYDVEFETEGPMGINLESNADGSGAFVTGSENPKVIVGHSLVAVNNEVSEKKRKVERALRERASSRFSFVCYLVIRRKRIVDA